MRITSDSNLAPNKTLLGVVYILIKLSFVICDISYSYLFFLCFYLIIQTSYDKFLLPSGWICCPVHKDCFSDCAMFPSTLPHRNSSITKS